MSALSPAFVHERVFSVRPQIIPESYFPGSGSLALRLPRALVGPAEKAGSFSAARPSVRRCGPAHKCAGARLSSLGARPFFGCALTGILHEYAATRSAG